MSKKESYQPISKKESYQPKWVRKKAINQMSKKVINRMSKKESYQPKWVRVGLSSLGFMAYQPLSVI